MFDTGAQAEFIARLYRDRGMGQSVAELRIPDASPAIVKVIVLKTGGPGHYLLLGCAETFPPLIVDTRPVGGAVRRVDRLDIGDGAAIDW
ncbi:MAG TPA: hypothetical protein VG370_05520 [Chloroflexota bacterium]|nr:hypothetical protein [Chloroflexota bacterium]